jgi:hypothetical protein
VFGHLDLNDIRPPIRKLAAARGSGTYLGQVDDPEPGKGRRGGNVRHGAEKSLTASELLDKVSIFELKVSTLIL